MTKKTLASKNHSPMSLPRMADQSKTLTQSMKTGTVGKGCGLEQQRYLKPNDVVELEVEKLGILRSRVIKPDK